MSEMKQIIKKRAATSNLLNRLGNIPGAFAEQAGKLPEYAAKHRTTTGAGAGALLGGMAGGAKTVWNRARLSKLESLKAAYGNNFVNKLIHSGDIKAIDEAIAGIGNTNRALGVGIGASAGAGIGAGAGYASGLDSKNYQAILKAVKNTGDDVANLGRGLGDNVANTARRTKETVSNGYNRATHRIRNRFFSNAKSK